MIPLIGDVRLAQALEEALSFAYPLRRFLGDYEAARAYARRTERARPSEKREAAPRGRRMAEDLLAFFRERYGRVGGTVRAVRCQLVLVALAEHWGELVRRGLAEEAGTEILPVRQISSSLLRALLNVEVTATGGPRSLRLDSRGVRAAIWQASGGHRK